MEPNITPTPTALNRVSNAVSCAARPLTSYYRTRKPYRSLSLFLLFLALVTCMFWGPMSEAQTQKQQPETYQVVEKLSRYCDEIITNLADKRVELGKIGASGHQIPIIQYEGVHQPQPYYDNSIYIHTSTLIDAVGMDRLIQINESFIKALGPKLLSGSTLDQARFITTTKSGEQEFVTIFEVDKGNFGGITFNLNSRARFCTEKCEMKEIFEEVIGPWLKPISGTGRLYIIGDELERLNPTQIAQDHDIDVIRRNHRIVKDLRDTESRLAQIQDRALESSRTVYVNGLPQNATDALKARFQRNEVPALKAAGLKLDAIARQFFKSENLKLLSAEELQDLFVKDESDVMLIVAHSDRERLYLNGAAISIDDIQKYPERISLSSRPRLAILVVCNGSNFGMTKGLLFKKDLTSLAEVLVKKNYFDKVVAPKGEIDLNQATNIVNDYFSGTLIRKIAAKHYGGLRQVAD